MSLERSTTSSEPQNPVVWIVPPPPSISHSPHRLSLETSTTTSLPVAVVSRMPRISARARRIRWFRSFLSLRARQALFADSSDDNDSSSDLSLDLFLSRQLSEIESRRYLRRNRYRRRRVNIFSLDLERSQSGEDDDSRSSADVPFLNDDEFLQKYRMRRQSFDKLVSLISSHPVFTRGVRGPSQDPVAHQLMSFLSYVGTPTATVHGLRSCFRDGAGTNDLYRSRVVTAILSISDDYYYWPDESERKEISQRIYEKYRFPNCVGTADGTLNELQTRPRTEDAADYSGRKFGYSLSTMVVNDDRRKIRYIFAGWVGSAHDNRVFRNSILFKESHRYFSEVEYILGDSAYQNTPFMVSAYKKPKNAPIPPEHENFNSALARPRVTSEHTIGMWKSRFPWLRKIPIVITEDPNTLDKICQYIEATVILHNFLIDENDVDLPSSWEHGSDKASAVDDCLSETDELNRPLSENNPTDARRRQLLTYVTELFIPFGNGALFRG